PRTSGGPASGTRAPRSPPAIRRATDAAVASALVAHPASHAASARPATRATAPTAPRNHQDRRTAALSSAIGKEIRTAPRIRPAGPTGTALTRRSYPSDRLVLTSQFGAPARARAISG